MKPRDYCCCAIPTLNAGVYATLTEQFALGIIVGVLSVATPSIVGAATPSFAPWILAILAFVAAGIQVFGFFGVRGERPIMYRRYVTLHSVITIAAFAVAAVWVIISASRHSSAESACKKNFFSESASDPNSTLTTQAGILCNIFPWVDVGLMTGLWVLLAAVHVYFYVILSSYGTGQRRDHEKYNSIYESTNALAGDIPMSNRNDPWDSRGSDESLPEINNNAMMSHDQSYSHVRQDSGEASEPQGKGAVAVGDYSSSYPPQSRGYDPTNTAAGPTYGYSHDTRQPFGH